MPGSLKKDNPEGHWMEETGEPSRITKKKGNMFPRMATTYEDSLVQLSE